MSRGHPLLPLLAACAVMAPCAGCLDAASCPPGDGVGAWRVSTGAGLPVQRHGHIVATLGNRFLVWGGVDALDHALGDGAWASLDGQPWLPMPAEGAPSARVEPASAVLVRAGTAAELVVFGGHAGGMEGPRTAVDVLGDGARLRDGAASWEPLPVGPAPRFRAVMVADPASSRVYLVGGVGADGEPMPDAWQLDLSLSPPAWTALAGAVPLPTPRDPAVRAAEPLGLAFRPRASSLGQLVLVAPRGDGGPVARAATFVLPNGPWVMDDLQSAPPARSGASTTWAPNLGRMMVHGGVAAGREAGSEAGAYRVDLPVYVPREPDPSRPDVPTASMAGTNTWRSACVSDGAVATGAFEDCGLGEVSVGRAFHGAAWLGDGLLVVGGVDAAQCGGAAVWDVETRRWSRVSFAGSPPRGRRAGVAFLEGVGAFAFGQHRPAALAEEPAHGALWVP